MIVFTRFNGSSAVVWLSFWFSTRFTRKKRVHSRGIYHYLYSLKDLPKSKAVLPIHLRKPEETDWLTVSKPPRFSSIKFVISSRSFFTLASILLVSISVKSLRNIGDSALQVNIWIILVLKLICSIGGIAKTSSVLPNCETFSWHFLWKLHVISKSWKLFIYTQHCMRELKNTPRVSKRRRFIPRRWEQ